MRSLRLFALALLSVPLTGTSFAQAAPKLLPHRAVYDLSLDRASDRSGINGITGRMVYEFAGSVCEGYTTTFRFVMRLETDDASRLSDQQTTTYEDGAGKVFQFVNKMYLDNMLDREVKGVARLEVRDLAVAQDAGFFFSFQLLNDVHVISPRAWRSLPVIWRAGPAGPQGQALRG